MTYDFRVHEGQHGDMVRIRSAEHALVYGCVPPPKLARASIQSRQTTPKTADGCVMLKMEILLRKLAVQVDSAQVWKHPDSSIRGHG